MDKVVGNGWEIFLSENMKQRANLDVIIIAGARSDGYDAASLKSKSDYLALKIALEEYAKALGWL